MVFQFYFNIHFFLIRKAESPFKAGYLLVSELTRNHSEIAEKHPVDRIHCHASNRTVPCVSLNFHCYK